VLLHPKILISSITREIVDGMINILETFLYCYIAVIVSCFRAVT
jgi:hypothetical protein